MTKQTSNPSNLEELLDAALQKLVVVSPDESSLLDVAQEFSKYADAANEAALTELSRGADVLARVLELASCWDSQSQDDPERVEELLDFVNQSAGTLERATSTLDSQTLDPQGDVDEFVRLAQEKWSDYLTLLDENDFENDAWEAPTPDAVQPQPADDNSDDHDQQIGLLLAALSDPPSASDTTEPQTAPDQQAKIALADDREMLEAYLDDALRCLSSMERSALEFEDAPQNNEPVEQFCRELHTLKGASATVGLAELATYLHELESTLESLFEDESSEVEAELLLTAVDRVREEIGTLQPTEVTPSSDPSPAPEPNNSVEPVSGPADFSSFASGDDSSIRIRAAKLDRLMDMLAELVVLRNRRESHVAEFNQFNEELARCASRLNFAEEESKFQSSGETENPFSRNSSCTFQEVATDITEVSKGMRELQKPVSVDNAAISGFIRDFRQELMQLRRIPVSGLFRRLQRAARDAAKTENKQVHVNVVGEHAGLEQEIQERLFESLLHIVRNAVSHGVESEEHRLGAGKNPVGTVTLEASSSAQLLIIEVRDDGNGVDYEAVRKRAIEKRLMSPDHRPTHEELAKLIFHPGFSTRQQASEVSGRGVGMDIVAKTIEQLHGRIEVDSVAGQGTSIRLSIPLRTGIEHVMVFRTGGQLFALPMQAVTAAKSSNNNIENIATLSWSSSFSGDRKCKSGSEDVLLLRQAGTPTDGNSSDPSSAVKTQIALAVDELVGPEEVVVRGLPNLLKHHPLFCGITLSGSGEKVLLLNGNRVLEFCHQSGSHDSADGEQESSSGLDESSWGKRALVVDDSLTARRVLTKILKQHGFTTVEAGDGIEAVERLHKERFDLVLTDLDMPRFGGLELLSDIQSSRYCDAPVVVVSSRDAEVFRTRAMDVGASDYITKPVSEISISQLLESLELLPEALKG